MLGDYFKLFRHWISAPMSNGTIWVLHWGSDRWWFHYDDVDTVAPLSLSLYEGAAFKLLFPIGIQWSLVPPADSWGMRFLYRSVWSHFAFFGLAWMCSYSFILFCSEPFTKCDEIWPCLYAIVWLVSILPNYARVFQSLMSPEKLDPNMNMTYLASLV